MDTGAVSVSCIYFTQVEIRLFIFLEFPACLGFKKHGSIRY